MSTNESETEMTERKMYALTDDEAQVLERCARSWGSVASHHAADQLIPLGHEVNERTYTREDMARAWDEGNRARGADAIYTGLTGCPSDTPNPYEQEEA